MQLAALWSGRARRREAMATMEEQICVFVAARQGPKCLQKYAFGEWPASTTLRQLGHSVLPAGELFHVEAAKEIDSEAASFAGSMLDKTVGFVVTRANLQYPRQHQVPKH